MNELVLAGSADQSLKKASESHQFLTFRVDEEVFGVDIDQVKEIIEITSITKVPMTPKFINGVINLRGSVVPVINLASRLGFEQSQIHKRTCIVLIELRDHEHDISQTIGMLVDQVNEIIEIKSEDVQPSPAFGSEIRVDFISGMGKVGNTFIVLLNMSRVLSVAELSQIAKAVIGGEQEVHKDPEQNSSEDFDF